MDFLPLAVIAVYVASVHFVFSRVAGRGKSTAFSTAAWAIGLPILVLLLFPIAAVFRFRMVEKSVS